MVSFTRRPPHLQGNNPRYPLERRLGGPQSRSGRREEEKNFALTIRTPDISGVQHIASLHTDCALPAANTLEYKHPKVLNELIHKPYIIFTDNKSIEALRDNKCHAFNRVELLLHLTSDNTVKLFCCNYSVFVELFTVLRSELRQRTWNRKRNVFLRMRRKYP
jgi:hypothetical protein